MGLGDDDHHLGGSESQVVRRVTRAGGDADEGEIEIPLGERIVVLRAETGAKHHLDAREARAEHRQHIASHWVHPRGGGPDPKDTGPAVRGEVGALHRPVDKGQEAIGVLEERLARGSQLNMTLIANEELSAERTFEHLDLL